MPVRGPIRRRFLSGPSPIHRPIRRIIRRIIFMLIPGLTPAQPIRTIIKRRKWGI